MHIEAMPSGATRLLGRSRCYSGDDLPLRLRRWHAPRANRWERLEVVAGAIDVQWLEAAAAIDARVSAGQSRWIAPGTRWRVAALGPDATFVLEVHADQTSPAAQPQPLRAQVLDAMRVVELSCALQWGDLVPAIVPGESVLVHAALAAHRLLCDAMRAHDDTLFWHPLDMGEDGCTAVLGRTAQPTELVDYLGRDHALIEAALAGALRGQPQRLTWLHNLLARHLRIEEDVLFPAYLRAGGREGWVRGLCNEHRMLLRDLPHLDDPVARRRLLLLLDGHDEKEEQIVYPVIVERLADGLSVLTRAVVAYPFVLGNARLFG